MVGGMAVDGHKVREYRERKGWSQPDLARASGVSQQLIDQIERGLVKRTKFLLELANALNVTAADLDPAFITLAPGRIIPPEQLVGPKDLPIYGSAEGGEGSLIVAYEPIDFVKRPAPLETVRGGYGLLMTGNSMVPAIRPGDIILVNPHRPPKREDVAVFYRTYMADTHATVKEYLSHTDDLWRVKRYQPEEIEFTMIRAEWQECHLVVGKYNR